VSGNLYLLDPITFIWNGCLTVQKQIRDLIRIANLSIRKTGVSRSVSSSASLKASWLNMYEMVLLVGRFCLRYIISLKTSGLQHQFLNFFTRYIRSNLLFVLKKSLSSPNVWTAFLIVIRLTVKLKSKISSEESRFAHFSDTFFKYPLRNDCEFDVDWCFLPHFLFPPISLN